jgi:hypothetical protein
MGSTGENASVAVKMGFVLVCALALTWISSAAGCGAAAEERQATGGSRMETGSAGGAVSAGGGGSQSSAGNGGSQSTGGNGGSQSTAGNGGSQSTGGNGGSQSTAGNDGSQNSGGDRFGGAGGGGSAGAGSGGAGGVAGGGTTGTSAVVEDVPAGTVCARLSGLQCEAEAACCKAPGRNVGACKAAMAKKCADLYLDQASMNPLSGYSPNATGLAMAEFQRRAATCDPTIVTWGASVSGLRGIFPGTMSQGADCTSKNLLDSGDVVSHLMACKNPGDTACLPGLAMWKCTSRASVGGACFSDTNCQTGLYCDNPQNALVGATCKSGKAVGASCTGGGQCESLVCKGSKCVPADAQSVYCLSD